MRTAIAWSRTHVHRRSTDAAPVLSDQNHKPLHVICTYTNLLFVRAFACLTSVCDAEQLYTDAAPAYSARAIRIKACSKDRTKRRPRCARVLHGLKPNRCAQARKVNALASLSKFCVQHNAGAHRGRALGRAQIHATSARSLLYTPLDADTARALPGPLRLCIAC
jgi:hypothetical protein